MKRVASLLFLYILACASLTANAQTPVPAPAPTPPQGVQPADEDAVVRISTNLIQVDATVTDGKGRVVSNLGPEDFEVMVNGKPQKITNFSFVTTEAPQPEQPLAAASTNRDKNSQPVPLPPARIRPEQVRRAIALVVDDLTIAFCNIYHVRRTLKKFVDEQMQPGDLVAIVRVGSGIGTLQQFTSDKRLLYAAIESVKYNMAVGRRCSFEPMGSSSASGNNNNGETVGIVNRDDVEQLREDMRVSASLATLNYVVRGMRDLPGRKAVMMMSEGFGLVSKENADVSRRIREAVERLVDSANRSGVVIYTMDVRGLVALGLGAEDDINPAPSVMGMANPTMAGLIPRSMTPAQVQTGMNGRRLLLLSTQEGLTYLAEKTGGFAVFDTNDLAGGIKKALDDQKSYYLIGFQPEGTTFDKTQSRFNHLTVKVKGNGLKVRYRSGFFGIKDEEVSPIAKTPEQQVMRALTSPFTSDDINLRLTALFGNDAAAGSFVRSLVHISTKGLIFTEKPGGLREAVINVVAYTFGDDGSVIASVGETHTITLTDKLYNRAQASGLVYSLNVPIKRAGAYQLRVAVRDDKSAKVGSASQFVNLPDIRKDRLTLSGIALTGYDLREAKNSAGAVSAPSTEEASGMLTQAAMRRFRAGQVLQFAYVIFNAKADKGKSGPQLTTQIKLYRDGKEIFAGRETPYDATSQRDLERLVAEGSLQLGGLQEGEYVLQVIATDLRAQGKNRTTTNWIDFEIVK